MIKKILVLSRYEAEAHFWGQAGPEAVPPGLRPENSGREALISIVGWKNGGPDSLAASAGLGRVRSKEFAMIECSFGDIAPLKNPEAVSIPTRYLFSEAEAHRIIAFLGQVKDSAHTLIVHCDGGVSRSGAVALFASRWLGLQEEELFHRNPRISPNPWVLEALSKAARIPAHDLEYWREVWIRNRG